MKWLPKMPLAFGRSKNKMPGRGNCSSGSPTTTSTASTTTATTTIQPRLEDPRLRSSLAPLSSPSASAAEASRLELEAVFKFMDTNGDGKVSLEELQIVLRTLGSEPSEEELRDMIAEVDSDGDGFISLDEFVAFNTASAASLADLRAAFHVFDLDGNGYISMDELHKVMLAVGEKKTTKDDCLRMIRGVDVDGDDRVDFEEFKNMMANRLRQ